MGEQNPEHGCLQDVLIPADIEVTKVLFATARQEDSRTWEKLATATRPHWRKSVHEVIMKFERVGENSILRKRLIYAAS
jgi:hypothetical protein